MTQLAHRPAAQRTVMRRTINGTAAQVAATVALVRQSGRLVAMTHPRQLDPTNPATVRVVVTLAPPAPGPARPSLRRWRKPAIVAAGIAATLAGTAYGLHALAAGLARTPVSSYLAIAVVILLACAALRLSRRVTCSGLHCRGCGRH